MITRRMISRTWCVTPITVHVGVLSSDIRRKRPYHSAARHYYSQGTAPMREIGPGICLSRESRRCI